MEQRTLQQRLGKHVDVYIPSKSTLPGLLHTITTIGVGAHPDDIELGMAPASLSVQPGSFLGVTCTNGAGSARGVSTKELSDTELVDLRKEEQRLAAEIGGYGAIIQLGNESSVVKTPSARQTLIVQLRDIFNATSPELVLTHNIADKHATHVGVTLCVIDALRGIDPAKRPKRVLGVEIWRGLDWLADADKQRLPLTRNFEKANKMAQAHKSQLDGKAYDVGAMGRRLANATFDATHELDASPQVGFALDLTPLVETTITPKEFLAQHVNRFNEELQATLSALSA